MLCCVECEMTRRASEEEAVLLQAVKQKGGAEMRISPVEYLFVGVFVLCKGCKQVRQREDEGDERLYD